MSEDIADQISAMAVAEASGVPVASVLKALQAFDDDVETPAERERADAIEDNERWLLDHDAPETRRTPAHVRMMRTAVEQWDDELGQQ